MPNAFLFFNQRNHVSFGRELYGVFDFCVCGGPYLFLGQKSYYLPFCFFGFSTVMDASRWVIQSYSHHFSYIVPLYFDWFFFFFGKLFYFDWLLVLKITLWSYLLKKKKKLCEVMIYERNGTIFTLFTTATVTSD